MYPKALDDTHCAQCCQDAQFLPNKGRPLCLERLLTTRNTWVSKLDSTVRCRRKIPCTIVKVQERRVPFCLDPVVISKEETSLWLWILERKLLAEAGM
jgi:hypothetical protein